MQKWGGPISVQPFHSASSPVIDNAYLNILENIPIFLWDVEGCSVNLLALTSLKNARDLWL